MKMIVSRVTLAAVTVAGFAFGACGGSSGGARKVIVNEAICGGEVQILRMKLAQTNHVILDNTTHSGDQESITLNLDRFPVLVKGDVPEGSTIGTRLSTIKLTSAAGEEHSVDLEPTGTGTYTATCNVSLHDQSTGQRRFISTPVTFQLVE